MNVSLDPFRPIGELLESGGPVLGILLVMTFVMWLLIIERYWYLSFQQRFFADEFASRWRARSDRRSRAARMIRSCWLSQFRCHLEQRIALIRMLVGISLLLGLLGTVTGMVGVFEGLSVFGVGGSGGIRAVADGIAGAVFPAMAGMVAALSGVYFSAQLKKRVAHAVRVLRVCLALE